MLSSELIIRLQSNYKVIKPAFLESGQVIEDPRKTIGGYEIIKLLGIGSFGDVLLVTKGESKFAMKVSTPSDDTMWEI